MVPEAPGGEENILIGSFCREVKHETYSVVNQNCLRGFGIRYQRNCFHSPGRRVRLGRLWDRCIGSRTGRTGCPGYSQHRARAGCLSARKTRLAARPRIGATRATLDASTNLLRCSRRSGTAAELTRWGSATGWRRANEPVHSVHGGWRPSDGFRRLSQVRNTATSLQRGLRQLRCSIVNGMAAIVAQRVPVGRLALAFGSCQRGFSASNLRHRPPLHCYQEILEP